MNLEHCPCGSQKNYTDCCGLYLEGGLIAPSPEALMRSRYTAFCKHDLAYIKKTWHPDTRPDDLSEDEPSTWVGLEIIHADQDGDEGEVEFRAKLIYDHQLETLHEISEFDQIDGQWFYHSGEFVNDGQHLQKIARNAACPCGSSLVYRFCHGRKT